MDYKERFKTWLDNDKFDEETKKELREIADNDEEIKDRFYTSLEFGTAGLRGKLGAGTNRMNKYMVAQASQGFADTISEMDEEAKKRGVAIAYDVRHKSEEFAKITASVFAANGIKVYIHKEIQPTPVLSYTVRKLNTACGVMVTASHNPMEYNGYKAYNEEGSQILDETANKILGHIEEHPDFFEIPQIEFEKGIEDGIISWVDDSLIEDYVKEVLACTINEDIDKDINIVYTPLNGCGNKLVRRILDERGFKNIHIVREQENPDPNFTTVGYPNPEMPEAFEYSEKLGKEVKADLLLATDPDSDRCAVEVYDENNGEFVFLTGNKIGSLLTNYILEALDKNGELPENGAVVKSLVSSDLVSPICQKYGVKKYDVLTGFKNIYAVANELEKTGEGKFIFGFEESIGYNYKDFVRDKDAVNSAMMIAEMSAYYKKQDKSLLDVLEEIYKEHGYYSNDVIAITLQGIEGQERIGRIMESFRTNPLSELSGLKVEKIIDYKFDDTGLPKSNVLKYYFNENSWLALRPSGTEPKIKMYINAVGDSKESAQNKKESIIEEMNKLIDEIK